MAGSSSGSFRSCSTTALVLFQILVVMALWALIMAVAGLQGDAGSDYLAEKEKQVQQIVAQVELNDIQTCVPLLTAPDMGAQLYIVTISSVWMCQTISIAMRRLVAAIAHNYVQNIA
ncbi:unnamed protein product [Sphagnum troendelagicum]|uniref:Uncharacterized protein n=1 Tax=Sphagnum troendelagicum TaxID=128251 RepID=A0ABP0UR15_9BRYO